MVRNGKSNKLPKRVLKLARAYGPRLWKHIDKMSVHRLDPTFEVGELVHINGFNLVSVFSKHDKDIKVGLIVAGPSYDKSYTYQDWEILDEPMYDIQFGKELRKAVPQRFLTKIKKEESSNFNSQH